MGVEYPLGNSELGPNVLPAYAPGVVTDATRNPIIPSPGNLIPGAPIATPVDTGFGLHLGSPGLNNDVWVSSPSTGSAAGKIGHYQLDTKIYSSFQMPSPPSTFSPAGVVVSPKNGNVYVASQGADGSWEYNPTSNTWNNLGVPAGISGGIDRLYLNPVTKSPFAVWANPSGDYSNFSCVFGEWNVKSRSWVVTAYNLVINNNIAAVNSFNFCLGTDNLIWYVGIIWDLIVPVSFDPATYFMKSVGKIASIPNGTQGIFSFICDGADDYLYVSLNGQQPWDAYIGRVKKDGSSCDSFSTGANTYPDQVCLGIDGHLYSTDFSNSQILRLDRSTGVITAYTFPTAANACVGVFAAPNGSIIGTASEVIELPMLVGPQGGPAEFSSITLTGGITISSGTASPVGVVAGKEGDIYFEYASYSGNLTTSVWWCSATGTPGTWVQEQGWNIFQNEFINAAVFHNALLVEGNLSLNNIATVTGAANISQPVVVSNLSASGTLTLVAEDNGNLIKYIKISPPTVVDTIAAPAGGTINGAASITVSTQYAMGDIIQISPTEWFAQATLL